MRAGNSQRHAGPADPAPGPGPHPTVDADSDSYRVVSVRMSEELTRRLKLAATLSGITQRELIILAIQPDVDRILREHNLE